MNEVTISLNVHELGVLISALQLLGLSEENRIAREYGSVPALYNKLYTEWEQMDRSQVGKLYQEITPSY